MDQFEQNIDYIVKTAQDVHRRAKEAGWWQNPREYISMCGLIITEITEAYDGYRLSANDDKLPHRLQIEVELADAFIRMGDTSIGLGVDLEAALRELGPDFVALQLPYTVEEALLQIIGYVSYSIEGHRKRDNAKRDINMAKAIWGVGVLASTMALDLRGAVTEKCAYNAVREDHKLENRMAEGGKKE